MTTAPAHSIAAQRSLRDAVVDYLHEAIFLPVMLAHALAFWGLFLPVGVLTTSELLDGESSSLGIVGNAAFDALGWPLMQVGFAHYVDFSWWFALCAANSVLWGACASLIMRGVRRWRRRAPPVISSAPADR